MASDRENSGKRGIRWDEDNLEENERIKKELNPKKIDEPKTPFHGGQSPMETDDEAPTFELQQADVAAAGDAAFRPGGRSRRQHQSAWSDSSDHNSPSPRAPNNNNNSNHCPRFSEEYYREGSDEDSEDPAKMEKKRRFKEARKKHYHMEFMSMPKPKPDQELEEEDDEDSEGDYPPSSDAMRDSSNGLLTSENGMNDDDSVQERGNGITMAAPNKSIL